MAGLDLQFFTRNQIWDNSKYMANLISVQNLEKSYGDRRLFKEISFGLSDKSRVGLVGPNGAGKSTLMKILAGQESPDKGDVVRSRGLKVAYLSQNPQFQSEFIDDELGRENSAISAKSATWLLQLGAVELLENLEIQKLSGGQKKKLALVRELIQEPDLLLLDEPTNHLDVESIMALEEILNAQSALTLLVVTHDRLFLQNVVDTIIDLDPRYQNGYLKSSGGYAEYLESREIILADQVSREATRANYLRREVEWLHRGAQARQTKQKARQESAYNLMDEVKELRTLNRSRKLGVDLSTGGFAAQKLIEAKNVSLSYGEQVLFQDFSILIKPKSRVAFLAKNGRGKSSLIKALLGIIQANSGSIYTAEKLSYNYFEQNRDILHLEKTLLQNVSPNGDYVHLNGQPIFAKSYLDRFHFRREQHDLAVKYLSGGEQSRLLIAKMMLLSAPVLVLDEPTNDLDIETLDTLRDALQDFEGALILVSHDRFFIEEVCDTIIAWPEPEDLLPGETLGHLIRFESILQWQSWKLDRQQKRNQLNLELPKSKGRDGSESGSQKTKTKLTYKEKLELESMEENILKMEAEAQELEARLATLSSDPAQLAKVSMELAEKNDRIYTSYDRWAELTEKSKS